MRRDPVKEGLVTSLNRPGGNATGINFFSVELVAKRMQMLRELVPTAQRIAVLINPTDPEVYQTLPDIESALRGQSILVLDAATGHDIDAAFATIVREKPDALFVAPGTFFATRRVQLAILAARHTLPAIYCSREWRSTVRACESRPEFTGIALIFKAFSSFARRLPVRSTK
jgi:putative tryptophan/tyrosine transport system substrate-binding protein